MGDSQVPSWLSEVKHLALYTLSGTIRTTSFNQYIESIFSLARKIEPCIHGQSQYYSQEPLQ